MLVAIFRIVLQMAAMLEICFWTDRQVGGEIKAGKGVVPALAASLISCPSVQSLNCLPVSTQSYDYSVAGTDQNRSMQMTEAYFWHGCIGMGKLGRVGLLDWVSQTYNGSFKENGATL